MVPAAGIPRRTNLFWDFGYPAGGAEDFPLGSSSLSPTKNMARWLYHFGIVICVLILFRLASAVNNEDECPCVNGICLEDDLNVPSQNCYCFDGYTGENCSINFDECLPGRNPCQNAATCINDAPEARCVCPAGYCGKYCEMEIDECHPNPCLNGGTCIDKLNAYECICPLGYRGAKCEVDIDACQVDLFAGGDRGDQRCQHGGTCKDGPGDRFFCVCPHGFTGDRCEDLLNPCDSSPCVNGGRCEKSGHDSFRCICPYGWSGRICQNRMQKCPESRNPCRNNAICMRHEEETICFCRPDYHGKHCQWRFDECQPNRCQNGATCVDGINGYTCRCPIGFAGPYCEIDCELAHENEELCRVPIPPTVPVEPSVSTIQTIDVMSVTTPFPGAPLVTTAGTVPTSTLVLSPTTKTVTVDASPTLPVPTSAEPNIIATNESLIYAPSFNGIDSELVYKMRRIKRATSSIRMTIIAHNGDGSIMHAYTSKYNLLLYLETGNLIVELNDHQQQNLLHLESTVSMETNRPYQIRLAISSHPSRSVEAELNLHSGGDGQLIQSVNVQKSNLTVPCFETYRLGQPPSITDNELFLKPFSGCIFNVELNHEERFPKDSVRAANIGECHSDVCQRQNPCRNHGVCLPRSQEVNSIGQPPSPPLWYCSCPPGYRGWLCQEMYCDQTYCHNGGLCLLGDSAETATAAAADNKHHLCICPQGFLGTRCEFRMNLTFPSFNIGTNESFIKYRLGYNLEEFFEIRFRFIAHPADQKAGLLMFMGRISGGSLPLPSPDYHNRIGDFVSVTYQNRLVHLRLNLGQGEKYLTAKTDANTTEQMVLVGRYRQIFWLLVVPAGQPLDLRPQVGRTPLHQATLNVDPYLYVGGHEDWLAHPTLYNLTGFKGCIYDIEIRISRQSQFTRLQDGQIDNLANIDQCDFDCT